MAWSPFRRHLPRNQAERRLYRGVSLSRRDPGAGSAVEEQLGEDDWATITEFSDGRTVIHANAEPTLTNLETRDTFQQSSRFQVTETFDPETNTVFDEIDGRVFVNFRPGDQGPFGEVEEPGLLLSVIGDQELTFDADTALLTSYSLDGTATDICALISG